MGRKKRNIAVSVINDLSTDQRVARSCDVLQLMNYYPLLIGRELKDSLPIQRDYPCVRFKMIFKKGPLFYAFYNLRLFFFLLFHRFDAFYVNDLDTLLASFLVARIKKKPLIYDTHEIFTEVPELEGRFSKKFWLKIEKHIFPHLNHIITVNDSIADYYKHIYSKEIVVVRNIPSPKEGADINVYEEFNLIKEKTYMILQGAGININRGAEELVLSMQYINNAVLLIVGGGDVFDKLKSLVQEHQLEEKVCIIPKQKPEVLKRITDIAKIGFSIDKDTNMNYHYSLPNKLFDYINSGLSVVCTGLVEVKNIVEKYQIGEVINSHDVGEISAVVNGILTDVVKLKHYQQNALKAAKELSWEKESEKLKEVIRHIDE